MNRLSSPYRRSGVFLLWIAATIGARPSLGADVHPADPGVMYLGLER